MEDGIMKDNKKYLLQREIMNLVDPSDILNNQVSSHLIKHYHRRNERKNISPNTKEVE